MRALVGSRRLNQTGWFLAPLAHSRPSWICQASDVLFQSGPSSARLKSSFRASSMRRPASAGTSADAAGFDFERRACPLPLLLVADLLAELPASRWKPG